MFWRQTDDDVRRTNRVCSVFGVPHTREIEYPVYDSIDHDAFQDIQKEDRQILSGNDITIVGNNNIADPHEHSINKKCQPFFRGVITRLQKMPCFLGSDIQIEDETEKEYPNNQEAQDAVEIEGGNVDVVFVKEYMAL